MILGIDASSASSGGGLRHLSELLKEFNPSEHGFKKVVVWGTKDILDSFEEKEWIVKKYTKMLDGSLIDRQLWQFFYRDNEFRTNCDIVLNLFGTYFGFFRPYVTMSRNMLVFDKNERKRFGFSFWRVKMKILYYLQKYSFNYSQGVIFISNYAKNEIGKHINLNKIEHRVIHHGVSDGFRSNPRVQAMISDFNNQNPFSLLYVSSVYAYKHTWNVVEAVTSLRNLGIPIILTLVGECYEKNSEERLLKSITNHDCISWYREVGQQEVANYYKNANAFIFASTCENMPNILVEAMASGLPITCSSFEPMPEFLKDGGIYFNPESVLSVENAIKEMIDSPDLREKLAKKSYSYSKEFSWQKCANETFDFLYKISLKK